VDEQGLLPYKLLTVPYSKHHELALSAVETSTTSNTASNTVSASGGASGDAGAADSAKNVGVAQTEEQQAYHTLLPYVLSPAQLHLWSYPTDKLLTSGIDSHRSVVEAGGVSGEGTVVDDEQPAKRARIEPSVESTTVVSTDTASAVSKGVTRGAEYLPTLTEAKQVLSALNTTAGWVTTTTTTTHTSTNTNTLLIAAIDCEMCETCEGSELTRVSVLTFEGIVVFDSLVKPKNAITNYQTQYSGITEDILRDVNVTLQQVSSIQYVMSSFCSYQPVITDMMQNCCNAMFLTAMYYKPNRVFTHNKSILQVQVALLRLLSPATLLVGHSLDSDLRALRLVHPMCVDTALLYPHPRGFPMRLKLKKLAEDYLQLRIQGNTTKGKLLFCCVQFRNELSDLLLCSL